MGWAKYYEDNVSICVGREVVRESSPVMCYFGADSMMVSPAKSIVSVEGEANDVAKKGVFEGNGRRGIELSFKTSPDRNVCRKLQMNGWWWSVSGNCWCNQNTAGNRKYANKTARNYDGKVSIAS